MVVILHYLVITRTRAVFEMLATHATGRVRFSQKKNTSPGQGQTHKHLCCGLAQHKRIIFFFGFPNVLWCVAYTYWALQHNDPRGLHRCTVWMLHLWWKYVVSVAEGNLDKYQRCSKNYSVWLGDQSHPTYQHQGSNQNAVEGHGSTNWAHQTAWYLFQKKNLLHKYIISVIKRKRITTEVHNEVTIYYYYLCVIFLIHQQHNSSSKIT